LVRKVRVARQESVVVARDPAKEIAVLDAFPTELLDVIRLVLGLKVAGQGDRQVLIED
jgi:hypothetical protein